MKKPWPQQWQKYYPKFGDPLGHRHRLGIFLVRLRRSKTGRTWFGSLVSNDGPTLKEAKSASLREALQLLQTAADEAKHYIST